jgi:hypothetical protein
MAYTLLHKYLHGMARTMVLTVEAVSAAEGGSVDDGTCMATTTRSYGLHKTM